MSKDEITLWEESEVQDLYKIVDDHISNTSNPAHELTLLSSRFGIELETGPNYTAPLNTYVYQLVKEANDSGILFDFLSYMINIDTVRHAQYDSIIQKHEFTIENHNGKFYLVPLTSGVFEKEIEQIHSYLEKTAPNTTQQHLTDAKDNFSKKKFDDSLADCRKALESLTTHGNFNDGVNELVTNGLILDGDNARKNDAQILRACYGYASTLGSHTGSQKPKPDFEQALVGMSMTQSCIRLILKRLDLAKQKNISLQEWI